MGKISIDEAYEKINLEPKEKPLRNREVYSRERIPLITRKELVRRIRMANLFRFIREPIVRFFLKRTMAAGGKDLLITWQPLYYIFIKTAVVVTFSFLLFSQYPLLSGWLTEGLAFFRLNEIYNFDFPQKAFFDSVAQGVLVFVIGYYGLYFLYYQILALFSSFAVSPRHKKAFYIRNLLVKKDLFVFSLPEMASFIFKQNIILRLLGMGTIVIKSKSGETVTIRSVAYAAKAIRKMLEIKQAVREQRESRRRASDEE